MIPPCRARVVRGLINREHPCHFDRLLDETKGAIVCERMHEVGIEDPVRQCGHGA